MIKMKLALIAALPILASISSSAVESGPLLAPDSRVPQIRIFPDNWNPDIKFYDTRTLSGTPAFRLDALGLYKGNTLLCRWPGGRFKAEQSFQMVLGYTEEIAGYEGCGEGGPVLSTWGDGGTGTAVMYIRADKRRGALISTKFHGKVYFFDLKSIPAQNWTWLPAGTDYSPGD